MLEAEAALGDDNAVSGSSHYPKRALSGFDLTMLGIGCIVGAGIFVLTGHAAATHAGPAIMLSFTVGK